MSATPIPACGFTQSSHSVIKAYTWICAFSATLSIIGSSLIIYIIARGGVQQLSRLRNRLLLGMSIMDIFSSAANGLSVIPTPQVTACSFGSGNLSTCSAQGFFVQLGLAVPGYNAMLSINYLMAIRYGVDPTTLAGKYEICMHAYAIILPLTTATIGVAYNMFFNEERLCWFGDVCQSLGNCPDGNIWGRGYVLVVITAVFTYVNSTAAILCMILIYWTLRKINTSMQRHAFRPQGVAVRDREPSHTEFAANECFKQALLYFAAYMLTYIWGLIYILLSIIGDPTGILNQAWYQYMQGTFQPLQGFWNFFAYVRPIVSAIQRREHGSNISFISALKKILTGENGGTMQRRVPIHRGSIDIRNIAISLDSESEDVTGYDGGITPSSNKVFADDEVDEEDIASTIELESG